MYRYNFSIPLSPGTVNHAKVWGVSNRAVKESRKKKSAGHWTEINFIAGVNDVDDVMDGWQSYVVEQRKNDLNEIITTEKLKP